MWEPMFGSGFGLTALLYVLAKLLMVISTIVLTAAIVIYVIQNYQSFYLLNLSDKTDKKAVRFICGKCSYQGTESHAFCPMCGNKAINECSNCGAESKQVQEADKAEPKQEQETDKVENIIESADPVKSADIIDKANSELATIISGEEHQHKSKGIQNKKKNSRNK